MKSNAFLIAVLAIIIIIAVVVFALPDRESELSDQPLPEDPSEETPSEDQDAGRVRSPEEITLRVGEEAEAAGLGILFNELVEDYRCPGDDASCPEAGAVVVNVTLNAGADEITLNITQDEVPFEFAGYAISIVDVAPALMTGQEIAQNEYEITFRIEPLAGRNPAENI